MAKGYNTDDYRALSQSQIPASVVETTGTRFDSAEDAGIFFARELNHIKAQTYDQEYQIGRAHV